jgi:FtsP/CotA-like multicopper oxidase with cupredoxin domain
VRSLAPEAAAGGTVSYTLSVQPGTYLYHSGTQPQVQVQMGLYGALIVEAGTNQAYAGMAAYSLDLPLVYSEIDPALHAAVASGTYGTPAMTSTLNYSPKYFLVNGEAYTPGVTLPIATGAAGTPTLLRLLNAGLDMHVPVLQGLEMSIVAEDGKPYSYVTPDGVPHLYGRSAYSAPLAPLKTMDAVITPAVDGDYAIYDRRLSLANNTVAPGGMLRVLRTGGTIAPSANHPPIAAPDPAAGSTLAVAPGQALVINVLANDSDPDPNDTVYLIAVSNPSSAAQPGTNNVSITGTSITYTAPVELTSGGTDTFNYVICDGPSPCTGDRLLSAGTVTVTVTP